MRRKLAYLWLRARVRFARWLTGWRVIEPEALETALRAARHLKWTVERSGHLSWRFHVRRSLEMDADVLEYWTEEVWR